MEITSVIIFFVITLGLGTLAAMFSVESGNFLERNLMRIGIGIGAFITLGLLFNLFRVPLDYRIFLATGLSGILLYLFKKRAGLKTALKSMQSISKPDFITKSNFKVTQAGLLAFAMLALFSITFFMHHKGAFSYPYLEDDDSWGHVIGVKYVSLEKTVFVKDIGLRYIDPYPPGYDMVLGVMHQTNSSVYWTLKFFNALIISLSIVFFYFFAKIFTASSKKAFFSAFALFAIPSFLSHFIWAIAITMPLFFVSFYCLEKIKHDKGWWIASSIVIAAALTTSPTHSTYFGIFLAIYLMIRMLSEKRLLAFEAIASFSGLFLSSILWWIPTILKHGVKGALSGIGAYVGPATSILNVAGTADRIYSLNDFFIAQKANMINNPIGIGIVLSLLLLIAVASLAIRNYSEIKKNLLKILIIFFISTALILLLLSQIYVKNPVKRNLPQLKPGSVPFAEFVQDQLLLIIALSVSLFLSVALIVIIYKNRQAQYANSQYENTQHVNSYMLITLAWLAFSFFAVNSAPFYYKLSPFRAWIVLAIPISIMVGEAISIIISLAKSLSLSLFKSGKAAAIVSFAAFGIIAYGVITTSFVQKYAVNTSVWPPGGFWTSNEEIQGYIWLKDNIPADSKVFTFSNNALVIGLDKFICHWCSEVQGYKLDGFNQTAEDNYNWLKKRQYKYLIIDGQAAKKFGFNETNHKVRSIISSNKFKPVFNNNGMIIFGVV